MLETSFTVGILSAMIHATPVRVMPILKLKALFKESLLTKPVKFVIDSNPS